jgi:hypothetical protein
MFGTANPWPLALGQIVPIAIATYYLRDYHPYAADAPNPLLAVMTILSVVSGGLTAVAATRARALWLRTHWTRASCSDARSGAFWGHNCFVLGVLLVALIAVGSWLELPTRMLVLWLGLLMPRHHAQHVSRSHRHGVARLDGVRARGPQRWLRC